MFDVAGVVIIFTDNALNSHSNILSIVPLKAFYLWKIVFFLMFILQTSQWNNSSLNECNITKEWWNRLDLFFNGGFHLLQILPQTAYFGFFNAYSKSLTLNHILLLFQSYLYSSRKKEKVTLRRLIRVIRKVKDIEKESAGNVIKRLWCTTKNGKILKICYFS